MKYVGFTYRYNLEFRINPRQPGAKKGHDRLRGTRDEL